MTRQEPVKGSREKRAPRRPGAGPEVIAGFRCDPLANRLLDSISDLVTYQDLDSTVLWANKAAADSVGLTAEELVGRRCHEIWHGRSDVCPGCPVVRVRETGQPLTSEITTPNGRQWLIRAFPVQDEGGGLVGVIEITTDITDREQAREAHRESEERLRTLFDTSRDAISITTEDGQFLDVNPAMVELLGYSRDEFAQISAADLYADPKDRERLRRSLLTTEAVQGYEVSLKRKDGRVLLCTLTTSKHVAASSTGTLYFSIVRDITTERQRERELAYLATHDPLTGLSNRASLLDRLELEIARCRRQGHSLAVLYLDLHGLKAVNDAAGHAAGDAVLREVAGRLALTVRESDTLGRLGGDEFALVAPEVATTDHAAVVATRVIEAFHEPFAVASREFPITVSVGIALYPRDGASGPDLLRKADGAMYDAKARAPNSFGF
jgi:diguanylate cyclase (GGDEF)-like protein/PAS domain S-box-containing protein